MKRFIVASGAAMGSTLIGVANSIVVVRVWSDVLAAEFFQIASLVIVVAVVGEAGLGNYAVHDSARRRGTADEQTYVNQALLEAAKRGVPAAAAAALLGRLIFDFGGAASVSAAVATWATVVAIVAQALFRGTGRDLSASLGGPIGATILSGIAVALGAITQTVAPVHLAAAGYTLTGLISYAMLWRPSASGPTDKLADLRIGRTARIGVSNVCNAAGRQFDVWIAGALLTGAAFNSYALAAKIAASVGVVSYAATQATAAETHRWVSGDQQAGRSIWRVHALAVGGTILLSVVCIALAPPVGHIVFGDDIVLSRSVLTVLLLGYVLTALSGAAMLVLVAADRSEIVLRASIAALTGALVVAALVALGGGRDLAAASFVLGWLGIVAVLSSVATRRSLGLDTFVTTPPHGPVGVR